MHLKAKTLIFQRSFLERSASFRSYCLKNLEVDSFKKTKIKTRPVTLVYIFSYEEFNTCLLRNLQKNMNKIQFSLPTEPSMEFSLLKMELRYILEFILFY